MREAARSIGAVVELEAEESSGSGSDDKGEGEGEPQPDTPMSAEESLQAAKMRKALKAEKRAQKSKVKETKKLDTAKDFIASLKVLFYEQGCSRAHRYRSSISAIQHLAFYLVHFAQGRASSCSRL